MYDVAHADYHVMAASHAHDEACVGHEDATQEHVEALKGHTHAFRKEMRKQRTSLRTHAQNARQIMASAPQMKTEERVRAEEAHLMLFKAADEAAVRHKEEREAVVAAQQASMVSQLETDEDRAARMADERAQTKKGKKK